MECSRGKASPTSFIKQKLFASSAGYCQNPECNENLFKTFEETEIHIAEIAHVISVNNGARKNNKLTENEKGSYENLILLCPNCHTTIDKAEKDFPEILIKQWKAGHKLKLENLFGIKKYDSRNCVREILTPIFSENKNIFETYGPNTDEKYNPESSMPYLWIKKIREFIIPNNRKILEIIVSNYVFLNETEKLVFDKFKQHVHDFENKHLFNSELNGTLFPKEISDIYV